MVRRLRVIAARLRSLLTQRSADQEFAQEVQEHLQLLTERFVSQGMSPREAATAARRQFGNTTLLQQRHHETRTFLSLSNLRRDVSYGARMLRKNPGSTASVVIALAVGIGMNACVFTFVNSLLLRPPSGVRAPGGLREIWLHARNASGISSYLPLTYPDYTYYRDHLRSLESVLAFDGDPEPVIWNRDGTGQILHGQLVSGNFFSGLGVDPVLGRALSPADDQAGDPKPVVVLGYAFWQQRLGSNPAIIGKSMMLNGKDCTVVGIAPPGFAGLLAGIEPDFWAPLTTVPWVTRDLTRLTNRNGYWLLVAGRLASGVKPAAAQAELSVLARHIEQAHPDSNKNLDARLFPASLVPGPYRGYVTAFTGLLMAVFGLVLLIACANAASLLLVRGTGRVREMAIRSALGAGRGRLVRQLLVEAVLSAALAGCAGVALAWSLSRLLLRLKPSSLPITVRVPLDWRVLCFTTVVSLLTGVVFGLVPELRSARVNAVPVLKEETQAGSLRKSRLRSLLMMGQIATSVVLLIGATLCVRSLLHANAIDPGFDTRPVAVATLDPGSLAYSPAKIDAFYRQLLEHVRALPGVTSASYVDHLPLGTARNQTSVSRVGPGGVEQNGVPVDSFEVAPDYFRTFGVTLLRGRDFAQSDTLQPARTVIMNEALARRLWPGQDPLGQQIMAYGVRSEVIGVVKTGKYHTLGEDPLPVLYRMQLPPRRVLVVRTSRDARSLLPEIRREVQVVDPNMAATELETMEQFMALPLFPARTMGVLLGASGLLALLLTSIGLFGVISYVVAQRTHEIGIRIAMGAGRGDVMRMVLRQGLFITLIGLGAGLAAALAASRLLSSFLYGIRPNDPATLIGVSLGLAAVALLACYLPAQRAMRIDPVAALRYE